MVGTLILIVIVKILTYIDMWYIYYSNVFSATLMWTCRYIARVAKKCIIICKIYCQNFISTRFISRAYYLIVYKCALLYLPSNKVKYRIEHVKWNEWIETGSEFIDGDGKTFRDGCVEDWWTLAFLGAPPLLVLVLLHCQTKTFLLHFSKQE